MLILVFFQIFLSTIKAEYPRCQFVSCFPDGSYSSRSCKIYCQSKQFPIFDSSMKKDIYIFELNDLENIPKYAFQFLRIDYLYIDGKNLKFVDVDAFTKIKKLDTFELTNVQNISLILNTNIFNYLSDFTTSLTITNSRINDNNLLVLLDQIKTWTKLITLKLDGNLIKKFNFDFDIFKSFKGLSLSKNLIESFYIKSQNLTSLSIASNKITKLEKEMLQDLPSLQYLDLSINRIEKIFNDTFLFTTRLHKLYLHINFINYIEPNSFCTIKSLGILSLSRNNLSSIKLYCLQNLILLYLRYVGYAGEIDLKRIGNPIYLEQLDLSDNNINKINFEKMVYLRRLDLSLNNISDIDKNTTKSFPNLSYLDISYNKFTQEIFHNVKSLKKLSTLHISNNFLTSIMPSFLAEYENLSELDLGNNQIENVEFPLLKQLKYLYLRNNKLRIVNENSFSLLKEIKELNLDSNLISQINSKAFFENKNLQTLSLANNFLSMKPDLQLSPRLTLLNLKNNSISYLTNYAFDTKTYIHYKLKIDLRKNNIIDLSTRTFCLSNLRISGFEFLIDDINKIDKCMLRQLDSRSSIQSNLKPGCEHILMAKHVNLQINGDISKCKNFSFDINKVCYSDNKFKCPNENKKRYTTWITGDPHLFSYKKNYELCSIGKDAVCFEHKEFRFLCSDTQVGNSNKQATVLTNLKFIYRVNNLVTFLHEFDSNSSKNKLNKNQTDIYENKTLLEIIEIDNGIISIFIPNSNTHIFILKWETYYSVALRTTHETYWESKGLFYEGCRQPDDLKSQRKIQKTTNRNIECETECSSIEIGVEDDNFPKELIKQICQFDCNELGKNSTEMIRSMAKSVSTFVLSDKYTNLTIDTPENIGRRNYENIFLNFGIVFASVYYFLLKNIF